MSVNGYPRKHDFYIVKLGFAGVYLFFLFLLENIDCGYTLEPLGDCGYALEPPRRGGSNVYPQSMFSSKNKKNIKNFLKFSIENFQFLQFQINLYITRGCFRNGHENLHGMSVNGYFSNTDSSVLTRVPKNQSKQRNGN